MMMRNLVLFLLLLLASATSVYAQDDLFGTKVTKSPVRKGWIISANGDLDFPAADMAKRFGTSARVGPSLLYKTKSNWLFGVKGDFIFGSDVREDSLLINLKDKYGDFLNTQGQRIAIPRYERGYIIGLEAGKIIGLSKKNGDNGLMLLTSVGFIQHKINIFEKNKTVPQLHGEYLKGYDRLTNGMYIEQYIGYAYFAKDGLLNFHLGLDALFGFTQGRRDFLYDVMRPDTDKRLDILFGLRGSFDIPIFKRKSEELFFQ